MHRLLEAAVRIDDLAHALLTSTSPLSPWFPAPPLGSSSPQAIYWKLKLAGSLQAVQIPLDVSRQPEHSFDCDVARSELSESAVKGVHNLRKGSPNAAKFDLFSPSCAVVRSAKQTSELQ